MRLAVPPEERLLATLRYLATGRYYRDLRHSSFVSHQLLSKIIPETCRAIYEVLKKTIKLPSTEEEWRTTAQSFESQWQFNNCVGCIDGKHVLVEKPPGSGSLFYNYKGTFSVVLFAIVNANYEFMYIHTGSNGTISDGRILQNTKFYLKLMDNELHLPKSYLLPETEILVPYVFLGDSAFALDTHIMTPFPESEILRDNNIFNYRLCRARRVVENAFGILASRFGVLRQPINLNVEKVDSIVLAICALHNFLRTKSKFYLDPSCVDIENVEDCTISQGSWRNEHLLTPLQRNIQKPSIIGKRTRNILTEYFNGVGRVAFQERMTDIVLPNNDQ